MYSSLKLMGGFKLKFGGDLYNWYYNNVYQRDPNEVKTEPYSAADIVTEINQFEKDILGKIRYIYVREVVTKSK